MCLSAFLCKCAAFPSFEAGVGHLAAACGLWVPCRPSMWQPLTIGFNWSPAPQSEVRRHFKISPAHNSKGRWVFFFCQICWNVDGMPDTVKCTNKFIPDHMDRPPVSEEDNASYFTCIDVLLRGAIMCKNSKYTNIKDRIDISAIVTALFTATVIKSVCLW